MPHISSSKGQQRAIIMPHTDCHGEGSCGYQKFRNLVYRVKRKEPIKQQTVTMKYVAKLIKPQNIGSSKGKGQ
ncbi:hypothetical protein TSUD_245140 [Trifolium subterraneum]|uniref:Uncharacterized protein n=1 Tax=Trifolium subterraneum TaxID=3900 RepID=A0A2Z6PEW8_TRISU|nr:hypothetical protein TSUD_245140 [Trifolium subterraneum]